MTLYLSHLQAIQVNDLYQSVLDLSITGIGMEFICVFGGQFIINSDGRDHMYIIPTQVCGVHKGTLIGSW